MNKREVLLSLLDPGTSTPYVPAGFFIFFDERFHRGQSAIDKHLEFFHYTGMDMVKIQYTNNFPFIPEIRSPEDWDKMPVHGKDFYEDPLNIAKGLVDAAGKDALVLMTLYSPYICAEDTVGADVIVAHLKQDPEATKAGMQAITDSLMIFIQGCREVGIDGFYHSTQGGESNNFEGTPVFDECIKPFDLELTQEIERLFEFNILHVCDHMGSYSDYSPFLEYPGHVVSSGMHLTTKQLSGDEIAGMFGRPFMGGMDREGVIVDGSRCEIEAAVHSVCRDMSGDFILGADCVLPEDVDWENIKIAIDAAHAFEK